MYSFLLAVAVNAIVAFGSLFGDELYENVPDGRFWAFYPGGVAIVNPDSCEVENTITQDHEGKPLPGWYEGAYMQYHKREAGVTEAELAEGIEGYVMLTPDINGNNSAGEEVGLVYVFGSVSEKVESVVEIGPYPVYSFGVHRYDEFWAHSDGDGHFYVIDLADITTYTEKVTVFDEIPGHGKLLWAQDGTLGTKGYANSVEETLLFQVDLVNKTLVGMYNFSSDVIPGSCPGMHDIAYSGINQHAYGQCIADGGTLEFDVSGDSIVFVAQHQDADGSLVEIPDGSFVAVTSEEFNMLHLLRAQATGSPSTIEYSVTVRGRPMGPNFYPTDNVTGGTDYIACMPLTSIPNANQIDDDGEAVCDYFLGCTGAAT
jgi:hypothetical protein